MSTEIVKEASSEDLFATLYNAALENPSLATAAAVTATLALAAGGYLLSKQFAHTKADKASTEETPKDTKETPKKTTPQLTRQHTELLDQIFNALDELAPFNKSGGGTFTSTGQAKQYDLKFRDKALDALVSPLIAHMNAFLKNADLKAFKSNCEKTFEETKFGAPKISPDEAPSFGVQAYDAVVCLFRALFRVFDYLVTTVTRSDQLMRDAETPFAQSLTGKLHFFEYSQTQENTKTAGKLKDLTDVFAEKFAALEALESITSGTDLGL